jgi:glycosyltransferase involved in cell wall biosynthesis
MVTVSVVIPTYNRADVLPRAIDSVLDQSLQDFEVLVIDDGSTDNTESVIKSYSDERIQYIPQDENRGANAARNRGIEESTGEYISFLDSDDVFFKDKLKRSYHTLEEMSEECAGVFTGYTLQDTRLSKSFQVTPPDIVRSSDELVNKVLNTHKSRGIGGFSSITMKRSAIDDIGLLDEELPSYQDLDLYIRALYNYDLIGIQEPLYTYYRHDSQISSETDTRIAGQKKLIEKHRQALGRSGRSYFHFAMGVEYGKRENLKRASKSFKNSILLEPTNIKYWYYYLSSLFGNKPYQFSMRAKSHIGSLYRKI